MPAIPDSPGSRSCRNDTFGAVWLQLCAQQTTLLASGCELWRMIRDPEFGEDVIKTGGMCCWTWSECGDKWPCAWLRTLSFDTYTKWFWEGMVSVIWTESRQPFQTWFELVVFVWPILTIQMTLNWLPNRFRPGDKRFGFAYWSS